MNGNLIMRVKLFISQSNTEFIKYDWDGGHSYSSIDHPIMKDIEDTPELESMLYEWLYNNDDCPPCQIHVRLDGVSSSTCGCNDDLQTDDILDIINQLESYKITNPDDSNNKYLITRD